MSYKEKNKVHVFYECPNYDGKIIEKRFLFIKWEKRTNCSKQKFCDNSETTHTSEYYYADCTGHCWGDVSVKKYKILKKRGKVLASF